MRRHLARWPILVGVVWLAFTVCAQASATGTVNGLVAQAGGPVVGARVVISSDAMSSYSAIATTNQSGQFTFSDAPVGGVEVKVYDNGGNMIVSGVGIVRFEGDVVTLALQVP